MKKINQRSSINNQIIFQDIHKIEY